MTEPDSFDPGPPRAVSRTRVDDRWAVTFTQVFPYPPNLVWSALTEPDELIAWAPYTSNRSLTSPGPATLLMDEGPDIHEFDGEVTVADAPLRLEHAWGRHRLQWRLRAVERGTELTLVHIVGDGDDPGELPMMAAGWHLCLVVVDRLLSGSPIGRIFGPSAHDHGFAPLETAYRAALGTAAEDTR